VVVVIAAIAVVGFIIFCLRRRRKRAAATNEVALRGMGGDDTKREPFTKVATSPGFSDNTIVEAPGPELSRADHAELHSPDAENKPAGYYMKIHSPSELYSPISNNHNEDYETAARMIESQRRAQRTPELPGSPAMYELPGDSIAAEMDDEGSRRALSAMSWVSGQSSSHDATSHLLAHSASSGQSPSLSPLLSPMSTVSPNRSSDPSTSHMQRRVSLLNGLGRQSSNGPSPMVTAPPDQTEPSAANRRSVLPRPPTVFTEEGSEPATPVVMVSPTLGRPTSSFMRSFSRSGRSFKKQKAVKNSTSSDATPSASWQTPRDSSWFI
jgi:hypothetical protein